MLTKINIVYYIRNFARKNVKYGVNGDTGAPHAYRMLTIVNLVNYIGEIKMLGNVKV